MTKKVVTVADNCIDCYDSGNQGFYPGGNAINTAVYLQRNGINTTYIGIIGNDKAGGYLKRCLEEENICLDYLIEKKGRTGRTFVEMRDGERYFTCDDPGIQVPLVLSENQINTIARFDLAYFSAFTSWEGGAARNQPYLTEELEKLRSISKKTKLSVDFSTSPESESLFFEVGKYLDFSFFSRSELSDEEMTEFIHRASPKTKGIIVVTRGNKGCAAGTREADIVFHPPANCSVVDTLGAGDAFIAGFLASAIKGTSLSDSLKSGTETAAVAIQTHGAWSNRIVEQQSADRHILLP